MTERPLLSFSISILRPFGQVSFDPDQATADAAWRGDLTSLESSGNMEGAS
jgi:hypothetical protein